MVPGIGGLRDDFSKLPAVRPSPLGQENISASNPAYCQSMNYNTNNYRNQQTYQPESSYSSQQQIPYYPTNDQLSVNSGSGSLSSSSTSLSSDYYNQGANYANQGNVNPIYQSTNKQPSPVHNQTDSAALSKNNFLNANTYQAPTAVYGNYASNYGQQTQQQPALVSHHYDYYKNQNLPAQTSVAASTDSSQAMQHQAINCSSFSLNNSYMNPSIIQTPQSINNQTQGYYQNQYLVPQQYPVDQRPTQQTQQYPVSQNSAPQLQQYPAIQGPVQQHLQYPIAQSPIAPHYSSEQSYQNSMTQPTSQAPASMPIEQPSIPQNASVQYSMGYSQNTEMIQQQAQQSFNFNQGQNNFAFENSSVQAYAGNQYGEHLNQQNYACYTPTINSMNSYMTAGDSQAGLSQTTQSVNYTQTQDVLQSHVHMMNAVSSSSPQLQPHSIPTYSAAVNATSTNKTDMQMTHSQQQISSSSENLQKPAAPKPEVTTSKNIDLLSGIDFTITNSTIDNIPTLTPVSVTVKKESVEDSPIKAPEVTPIPKKSVKLNEDLADLDFNSLTPSTRQESVKPVKPKIQKIVVDPFEDSSVLKHFHKEVEGLEKFMETLTVKTLNGVTPLANKWKELQDLLVKDEANRSVSVARLFPDKNRSVDCLPYDHARVLLPTATDNYINAVLVKDCGSVGFIITQTPMVNTVNDYWEMVWAQKSNILVCLHSPNEVIFINNSEYFKESKLKLLQILDPFWPQKVDEEKTYGEISIVLLKQIELPDCIEKFLKVTRHGSDDFMDISLLQIKSWKKT